MSTALVRQDALVRQEILEETVEVAEPEEAQAESADGKHLAMLAQVAEARIENMSLAQLERFVTASEKSEGQPYRDRLVADELKIRLRELRVKATTAMQPVVEEEVRRKTQAWHFKLKRALKSKDLLIPFWAAAGTTAFWTTLYLIAGHVPAIESVMLLEKTPLPFELTRWLDVPCIFVAAYLLVKSLRNAIHLNGLSDESQFLFWTMTFSLGGGSAMVGVMAPYLSGLSPGFNGYLGFMPIIILLSLLGKKQFRLIYLLASAPGSALIYGLTYGPLASLPYWLPPGLIAIWHTNRLLKKQRGW